MCPRRRLPLLGCHRVLAHVPYKLWRSEKHRFTLPEVKGFILGNPGSTA